MTGSQQSERRSQEIQAAAEAVAEAAAMVRRTPEVSEVPTGLLIDLRAVLAVPPAEPQEGERRVFMCPLCGRVSSVAEYCTRPICVHSWEGNAGCPEVWDGDNVDGEGRLIEQSPQESFRSPGPHTWAEMVSVTLGSVREPGPRYDVRVASLLDTEVQRLATLADETEGPAAERFVRQARYVSGVLDDVVERREPGPNVTEELAAARKAADYWCHRALGLEGER